MPPLLNVAEGGHLSRCWVADKLGAEALARQQ
jgi:hypothetical protein